jgi:hypothetical protein
MQTIQFIQHAQKQLQSKTTLNPQHQLEKSCKTKKGKKMIGEILSIFQDLTTIVRIISPTLLDNYHYQTIYCFVCLLSIFLNIMKKPHKTKKTASFEAVFVPGAGVEPARFPTGV